MTRIIIFLILNFGYLTAQEVTKTFFKSTHWFVNDKDSVFYKSDTISLIKYENYFVAGDSKVNSEYESKFLGHGDYIKIELKKNGQLYLTTIRDGYIGMVDDVKRYWKYSEKHKNLILYTDKKIIAVFEPISVNKILVPSRQSGIEKITTTELKFKRTQ